MRIHVQLFDDKNQLIGEDDVVLRVPGPELRRNPAITSKSRISTTSADAHLDYSLPERAFMKKHSARLSGAKKFTLLLAYLAKGKAGQEVQLAEIAKRWNKMTSILGYEFNRFFTNAAKENGWVDVKKAGVYVLRPSWREVFHDRH